MQRLLLIRHGESEFNREGRIQGYLDCDLSELGLEQAARLQKRLDKEKLDVAFASTATRATETARIAVGHRLNVEPREGLREINLGVWEGEIAEDLKKRFPQETAMWFRRRPLRPPPRTRLSVETIRGPRSALRCVISWIHDQMK